MRIAPLNSFIRDKHGQIVMWQFPSPSLFGWVLCRLGALFVEGDAQNILEYVGTGFLLIWAILEITQGASGFRRALGALVLLAMVLSFIFS